MFAGDRLRVAESAVESSSPKRSGVQEFVGKEPAAWLEAEDFDPNMVRVPPLAPAP
ncbi:hypothetical protein [Arthrobacter bambusae]|uniref:hypothetical protein n=1 Tax=Arthrobacter bambusae TaxID=1338426 RepID=UPI0027802603|nr:hypothetical protein [Arthrobacter bambusae]MDQ0240841.1 hypothetical protein [Arthrobacter bambusae]